MTFPVGNGNAYTCFCVFCLLQAAGKPAARKKRREMRVKLRAVFDCRRGVMPRGGMRCYR